MILLAVIVFVCLAFVAAILGLFAVPAAEPVYMGVAALASAAAICTILIGLSLGAALPS